MSKHELEAIRAEMLHEATTYGFAGQGKLERWAAAIDAALAVRDGAPRGEITDAQRLRDIAYQVDQSFYSGGKDSDVEFLYSLAEGIEKRAARPKPVGDLRLSPANVVEDTSGLGLEMSSGSSGARVLPQPTGDNHHSEPAGVEASAAVADELTDPEVLMFLSVAMRHVRVQGDIDFQDIRDGFKVVKNRRKLNLPSIAPLETDK
jgi:hypothetical protein